MSKVNTSKSMAQANVSDAELQRQVNEAAKALKNEKMVKVSIPKALAKGIGQTLPLGLNGAMIVLPVDGTEHEIPESFKLILDDFLENLNG